MSANYDEEIITGYGHSHKRINQININNPYGDVSEVMLVEEKITVRDSDDKAFSEGAGSFLIKLEGTELTKQCPLLNPLTGEDTGEVFDLATVSAMLYSLYVCMATERDS
jgi:hypothetical protein